MNSAQAISPLPVMLPIKVREIFIHPAFVFAVGVQGFVMADCQ
jgi:hypothetical protein